MINAGLLLPLWREANKAVTSLPQPLGSGATSMWDGLAEVPARCAWIPQALLA